MSQAIESLWVDELYVVVVQVESHQTLQAFECAFIDFLYFIKGHLQDLPQEEIGCKTLFINIFGIIKMSFKMSQYGNCF